MKPADLDRHCFQKRVHNFEKAMATVRLLGQIRYVTSLTVYFGSTSNLDWLQSLKQFFINVSFHILVDSLTLMALF